MLKVLKREDGQDLLEYSLLVTLIAMFALGAVKVLGDQITSFYWTRIGNASF